MSVHYTCPNYPKTGRGEPVMQFCHLHRGPCMMSGVDGGEVPKPQFKPANEHPRQKALDKRRKAWFATRDERGIMTDKARLTFTHSPGSYK